MTLDRTAWGAIACIVIFISYMILKEVLEFLEFKKGLKRWE